ncbi:MAG: NADPH:quinone reductase-like Zn-dependent oxidoreductase [Nitriliruptoraceae bacterium]
MTTTQTMMQAMTRTEYGDVDALLLKRVDVPTAAAGELLVRVVASSINPADRYHLIGKPYMIRAVDGFPRPRTPSLGTDVAGTVLAIGADVAGYTVGDRVFGGSGNAYAEVATLPAAKAAHIPDGVTFEQAACLPIAGATALQGLRKAGVKPGDRVLVNGASGGVGHLAVQIAKAMGAHVTGVCSTPNIQFVRSLGADEVIDYTTTDYATTGQRWDVLLDNHGNHSPSQNAAILVPGGRWTMINGPMTGKLLGPMRYIVAALAHGLFSKHKVIELNAKMPTEDMATLASYVASGEVVPHVQRTFTLAELPAAMTHLATNRTRGKLLVQIGDVG